MSRFISLLSIRHTDRRNEKKWELIAPLAYQSELLRMRITVPDGFKTDLNSCPRLPVIFFLFGAVSDKASALHDYCYTHKILQKILPINFVKRKRYAWLAQIGVCPYRLIADELLLEASKATGSPWWRRYGIFIGLRFAGWTHWN